MVLETGSFTDSLCKPLAALFNKSPADGVFPVYKKGNKSDKVNYRPISLLSNMSKVLEKIVFKRLYEYLTEKKVTH